MSKNAWLTPNNDPTGTRCIRIEVPAGDEWEAIFRGALVPLTFASNFEEYGAWSADDTAKQFLNALEQIFKWEGCLAIGSVIYSAGNVKPDFALWCDGSQVLQTDWPLLYSVLGTIWGTADSGYFRLPDLRSRFPVGAGAGSGLTNYSLGGTGGEESHSLTDAENGPHTHGVRYATLAGQAGGGIAPSTLLLPSWTVNTNSSGSGTAHENRPPYAALNAYIIGR